MRLCLPIILFSILTISLRAQYNEVGITVGCSYYIGDLNPYKHYGKNTKLAFGVVYRKNLTTRHVIKCNALFIQLESYDSNNGVNELTNRNLSFRNNIIEFSGQLEINFFDYEIGNSDRRFSPYLFGGLAIFKMNPQASYNGNWIDLQGIGTEGQGIDGYDEPYKLTQLAIPFGVGIKLNLAGDFALSAEWGIRKTYTDYIDDVSKTYVDFETIEKENGPLAAALSDRRLVKDFKSTESNQLQRGNPQYRDWYVYSGVLLTYRIGNKKIKCPSAY
jgi:Domain of unknown function (DUF6089)